MTETKKIFLFLRYLPDEGEGVFEFRQGEDGPARRIMKDDLPPIVFALAGEGESGRLKVEICKVLIENSMQNPGMWVGASSADLGPGQPIIGKL